MLDAARVLADALIAYARARDEAARVDARRAMYALCAARRAEVARDAKANPDPHPPGGWG